MTINVLSLILLPVAIATLAMLAVVPLTGAIIYRTRGVRTRERDEQYQRLREEFLQQQIVKRAQAQHRERLVGSLTLLYTDSHNDSDISPEVRSGEGLPPKDWMNQQLERLGENWRIL
jgi:hypothetical protein